MSEQQNQQTAALGTAPVGPLLFKTFTVNHHTCFFSDFFCQFNWESICIVEFEDILSSDNVLTFFFQVSYNGFCKVLT